MSQGRRLDVAHFKKLCCEDENLEKKVVETFLPEAVSFLRLVKRGIEEQIMEQALEGSAQLIVMSSNIGAERMEVKSRELLKMIEQSDWEHAREVWERLKDEFNKLQSTLLKVVPSVSIT
eukprot:TRINITY_DN889_c0_g1_i1.p1 TRINITY_DN889_c0_g1~~TRINITY_DN889_c0_g1_i1.p1  ORF type:complete len:120 (-),score=19.14 TRINITY_DN889_c0_g1_i1:206-565(-)